MRNLFHAGVTALAATALSASGPAHAGGFADPGEIDNAVAQFSGVPIGQPGGARMPVDRRLRLEQCAAPLAVEWYGPRGDAVKVSCPAAGWRIFVAMAPLGGAGAAPGAATRPGAGSAATGPAVVRRGEAVSIVARGTGFTLSRQGEALEDGAVDEWIKVRPAGDRRADPIRARVLQPGQVTITLP